jgi:hypothetical protein
LVLRILDAEGCTIPPHDGFPGRTLGGEEDRGTSGLMLLGNLHPQGCNIHSILGQELWEQGMRKYK